MDRDIRITLWLTRLLIAANLVCAIVNFAARNYLVAFASMLWTANCWVLAGSLRREARVRDEIRPFVAMRSFAREREKKDP
jgi:type IV secretory pathway TrbD component